VKIGQEIVTLNKQLAEIAERRYKAGDVSELDYNLILVEMGRSSAEQLGLESQLKSIRTIFNRFLGRSVNDVTEALSDTSLPTVQYTPEQLVSLAFNERQDWKAIQYEQSATSKNATLSWLNLIPNPKLSLSLSRSTSVFEQDNLSGNPAIITGISQIKRYRQIAHVPPRSFNSNCIPVSVRTETSRHPAGTSGKQHRLCEYTE